MHHPTDRIAHTTALCYTSRGALAGTRNKTYIKPAALLILYNGRLYFRVPACWLPCSVHLLRGWLSTRFVKPRLKQDKRERNVLLNDALNTFYLRLYGIRHMVKDHSDSEKGNPLPPHRLLLSINSKGSFI